MNPMKTYLRNGLLAVLLLLGAVAALNAVVDPYHVFGSTAHHGLFAVKPQAGPNSVVAKAHLLPRVQPRGLILGNSRAEVGFDPEHRAWPTSARPVFNAAQPGLGPEVALAQLKHALGRARDSGGLRPGLIVMGVDFVDFMPVKIVHKVARPSGTHPPASVPAAPAGDDLRQRKDYVEAVLTTGALVDSILTVGAQARPDAANLTELGFNPMRDYQAIAKAEGYARLFDKKNGDYAQMLAGRSIGPDMNSPGRSPAYQALDDLLALARSEGIEVRLVLYPYHVDFLALIHRAGLWPAWEAWKRDLVQLVEAAGSSAVGTTGGQTGGRPVPIFDFTGVNPWTAETVPAAGDRRSTMQWYWESGHFKQGLGAKVLDIVLAASPPPPSSPEVLPFTQLTAGNLAASQATLRDAVSRLSVP